MPVRWLVLSLLLSPAFSFIRNGIDCEQTATVEFGYDILTTCQFSASNCSTLRNQILDTINSVAKDIDKLDDGTGKEVPLIKRSWGEDLEDDNVTECECRLPVGVELKILYNPVRTSTNRFTIVGASLSVEEKIIPTEYPVRLAWSVLFREVTPKSNVSRWWEEMTSRGGSSYSLLHILDGFSAEGYPSGSYLFFLGLTTVSCLVVLKPYY